MSTSFPQLDKSKYYTKVEMHSILDALALGEYEFANAYYNKDYIDALLEQYYTKGDIDTLLANFECGGSGSYTNTTPVPSTVGGITAGTTFEDVPVTDVITQLLYPYQVPAFTAFAISGQTTTLEVGQNIPAGTKTFTWSTSNGANIKPDTIKILDVTNSTTLVDLSANDGTESIAVPEYVKNTATSHTWRIEAKATSEATISRNFAVNWQWKVYYGESALGSLVESDVEALRVGTLKSSPNGTYNMLGGGYKWICYPTAMGLKTTFKDVDTNFDVAMNPVETVSITNQYGVTTDYYCHRTYNVLGGGINIGVS